MKPSPRIRSLWRNLFRRSRVEVDLDQELRAYVDELAEEKRAAGMEPGEARRKALLETGGVEQVKESVREVRAGALLETVIQDVRYGARTLFRSPGSTAAAIVALALGIGASTAIFSVVNAVLIRPLPYGHPERIAVILHGGSQPVSPANLAAWRKASRSFRRMGAAEGWNPNLTGSDRPENLSAVRVTSEIFSMLEVPPLLGRFFLPGEDEPGRDHSVVLGHGLWSRRFGADPKIVGRRITLNGEPYTVVGVMPPSFHFPPFWNQSAEIWAPLALSPRFASQGESLRVFGEIAPGSTRESAAAEMASITDALERQTPGTNRDVRVRSLKDTVVGNIRPALLVLFAAVAFVLLIACANVAHLLLARAAARQREMAVRTAIGASRSRITRQLLTESLLLAGAGGLGGILIAAWGVHALVAASPGAIPRVATVALDARVLVFTLAISFATGIAFGLAPALALSRRDLTEALREGERGSTEGGARSRLRGFLVGSEFALALVLLVGAGLMIRSLLALQAIDPGFDPRGVLTMVVSVKGTTAEDPARRAAFYQQLLERTRALPGVQAAGAINHLPLAGDIWGWPFEVEGRPPLPAGETQRATYRVVLPGYLETMRVPLVAGRGITSKDVVNSPRVVVINEDFARKHWPAESAIGRRILLAEPERPPVPAVVVGIAKNTVRDLWSSPPSEEMYLAYLQTRSYLESDNSHLQYLTLVVRTGGDPAGLTGAIRGIVGALDRNAPVSEIQTMESVVAGATGQTRFYVVLLGAFAGVALLLAAVGIYGVMAYSVSRRTHEIGIRMALGARPGEVLRLVVRQGLVVALAGTAAGAAGAAGLTRLMGALLYGVAPTDLFTFAVVSGLLIAVAVFASWLPARRATRIDPLSALRYE
ncbi:MAG: ABC transporter permease [Acidobacteriota bacterium]